MNKLATAAFAFLAATGIALAGVDANTASRSELESIPGIGPATSARIVEARRNRPFADTQDLMRRVKGIGEARLARMVAAGLSVGGNGVIVTVGGRRGPTTSGTVAGRGRATRRATKTAQP